MNLPAIKCRGLCHDTCGPVPMTAAEVVAVQAQAGLEFDVEPVGDAFLLGPRGGLDGLTCPLLGPDRRCRAYEARPLICRLYGVVDNPLMRCPHGCVPDRYLTDQQARELLP